MTDDAFIYLDYNATTPIDKEVADAMQPYLYGFYGNPSSSHKYGVETRKAVELARRQVAQMLECESDEIVFTSGGSESDNYAIKGVAHYMRHAKRGNHIITSAIEHPAVIEVCKYLEQEEGFEVTYVKVDDFGRIDPHDVAAAIRPTTILITIMHSNNEVGTLQPIREICDIAQKHGILVHSDAAQSLGKCKVSVRELGVDLLTVVGHKFYAPKGIGALFIRRGVESMLHKEMHGAGHERNRRAGTENIIHIVGLGKAAEIVSHRLDRDVTHMTKMRDLLHELLVSELGSHVVHLNGHPSQRLSSTLSVAFRGVDAQLVISALKDTVAFSAGAACHADTVSISAVLQAMNVPMKDALGTLRFSVGRSTTEAEIVEAAKRIAAVVRPLLPSADSSEVAAALVCDLDTVDDAVLSAIKLTATTAGLGCGCKLRPQALERVLAGVKFTTNKNVLVGIQTSDDAGVYKINDDLALVLTVDFFTPVVDDAYVFGQIAAANALSDVYAMGGVPLTALSVVGFPSTRLPLALLRRILLGAQSVADAAGCIIIGGHTIDDNEPKFGLAVTGRVHPDRIWENRGAKSGDCLLLTKPLGVGIASTAMKQGLCPADVAQSAIDTMVLLNKYAADVALQFPQGTVHACTDVTGFGLLGHLMEMCKSSRAKAHLYYGRVPVLPGAEDLAIAGAVPGGTKNNAAFVSKYVTYDVSLAEHQKAILCDAQTSGGLLFAIARGYRQQALDAFAQANVNVWEVGQIDSDDTSPLIHVSL